jgi:hypothetical protein
MTAAVVWTNVWNLKKEREREMKERKRVKDVRKEVRKEVRTKRTNEERHTRAILAVVIVSTFTLIWSNASSME